MPFISSDEVAQMRKAIRRALPKYEVSVTKRHHSGVDVALMRGPIPVVKNVNVYWYKDHLKERPDAVQVIDTILAEIRKVRAPKIVSEDGDYGSIPNFYYDVSFGKWDKPYVCTDPEAEANLPDQLEIRREFDFVRQEIGLAQSGAR